MSVYLKVSNLTESRVVIAKHGEAYTPDSRIVLEPNGMQNAVVVVKTSDWKDDPNLLKLADLGYVFTEETDTPTVKQPYAPRDSELPSDKWKKVAVIDLVTGPDARFRELIELDTRGDEEEISDSAARQYMRTDYMEILVSAAKWLGNLETPRDAERLSAVKQRIVEMRDL